MHSDVYQEEIHQSARSKKFKAIKALIKDGIIKANLIPAFAAGFLAVMYYNISFFDAIPVMLLMLVGTALVIGGVCALNNYYDRDIDVLMKSKSKRPSIDGTFSGKEILIIGFSMLAIGLVMLFFINTAAGVLGLIAAFGYAVVYSIFAKRHLVANTVIGAIPGAMPPLIGWAIFDQELHILAVAMFIVMFIWQMPHFYALAIKRSEEYSHAGIPMLPSVKGNNRTKHSMIFWVTLLLFTPLMMFELGTWFVLLVTALNLVWFYLGVNQFKQITDYNRYAGRIFVFSLNYVVIFFVMVIVAGLLVNV
ncbi:heme o synthase [Jeotgalicoccus sp. ATCC 8456]|uniref:heme o synthase n=1 Tax=Jeotgalicoccus sp. ATCC 8456 TaxID=946435 RepID=UPI0018E63751|nr:heme o synthase [Jeotgalicoccus sp. ATCC 8456]QQD85815.1 protoheme IX farnesyltransferase [Jeotgalicoccus sp. ATCC 8456]